MRSPKKICALLLALALMAGLTLSLAPLSARAAYESSGDGDIRLTVNFRPGGGTADSDSVERQGYRLYQIATIDADGKGFTLTDAYKDLVGTRIPTTMTPYNAFASIDWDLVQRTGVYINENAPEPTFAAPIVDGQAVFTGLPAGLYLGTGPSCVVNGKTYSPVPFVISLPYMAADGQALPEGVEADVFYTDVTVGLKFSTPGGGHTPRTPDQPDEPDEPTPPPDEPPLDIPDEPVPLVDIPEEPVPLVDIPDEPTPLIEIPDQPAPVNPETPKTPSTPKTPKKPAEPGLEIPDEPVPLAMLPQTGLLWWPVPVMGIAGLILTTAGMAGRRRAE